MAEPKLTYPLVLQLEHPVQHGSELISELRFNRPKGKHFRQFKMTETDMGEALDLLATLAGQPPSVFDEMDWDDIQRCTGILGKLFRPSPQTSTKP